MSKSALHKSSTQTRTHTREGVLASCVFKDSFDFDPAQIDPQLMLTYNALDLEREKKLSYEEGYSSGILFEKESQQTKLHHLTQELQNQILALQEKSQEIRNSVLDEALDIVWILFKKVAPSLSEMTALDTVKALLKNSLETCFKEPRLVVHTNPKLSDDIKVYLEDLKKTSGFEGVFMVESQTDIPITECRIEWQEGGIEKIDTVLLGKLEKELLSFRNSTLMPPHATVPSTVSPITVRGQNRLKINTAELFSSLSSKKVKGT